jgi:hypothetical protein
MATKYKTLDDFPAEMYDTSDVKFSIKDGRRRNEVTLVAKAETDFNLVKFYLALKEFVEKIERELNIMDEAEGDH